MSRIVDLRFYRRAVVRVAWCSLACKEAWKPTLKSRTDSLYEARRCLSCEVKLTHAREDAAPQASHEELRAFMNAVRACLGLDDLKQESHAHAREYRASRAKDAKVA